MNDEDELDQLNIIKQIGKGSFSNVYLCQSSQLGSLQLEDIPMYYIIKEININSLVRKYLSQNTNSKKKYTTSTTTQQKQDNKTWDVNITPYKHDGIQMENISVSEDEYYFNRLKELVESEIDALKMLEHKNIIQLYGGKFLKGVFFLTMEYCDLGDVYQKLKADSKNKHGMSETFVIDFVKQTSIGLKYMHDRHVIHRDIKLQNILMQRGENGIIFKISDFGFACYDLSNDMKDHIDVGEVLAKKYFKLCGTPFYMAPEIILNMNLLENFTKFDSKGKYDCVFYSTAIDIWSYGVCVYELVYDCLPFPTIRNIMELETFFTGETAQTYINNRINERKGLNSTIKNLLSMMLQVDPSKRCSCDQIVDYLDNMERECVERVYSMKDSSYSGNSGGFPNPKPLPLAQMDDSDANKLKKHIVDQPIDNVVDTNKEQTVFENVAINDSWEHINKGDSLMMKVSVEKGFFEWLMNKK